MSRLSAALSSATQHAMPPEFGRKWGTECLNTRFPLPTLLSAGYSVKLIYVIFIFNIFNIKYMFIDRPTSWEYTVLVINLILLFFLTYIFYSQNGVNTVTSFTYRRHAYIF